MGKFLSRRRVKMVHGAKTLPDTENLLFISDSLLYAPTAPSADVFLSIFSSSLPPFFFSICQLLCFILWEDWGLHIFHNILSLAFYLHTSPFVYQEGILYSFLTSDHQLFFKYILSRNDQKGFDLQRNGILHMVIAAWSEVISIHIQRAA